MFSFDLHRLIKLLAVTLLSCFFFFFNTTYFAIKEIWFIHQTETKTVLCSDKSSVSVDLFLTGTTWKRTNMNSSMSLEQQLSVQLHSN